jgi:glycosyltransferase involved in cell wall biosynthesis
MGPLVSILIPAYNAERWLADTIRSALAQTWPYKEIIVVDDGSRDETLSVARQFTSSDVSVVTQANLGASAARNHALSLSHGDYIQWLDADDLLCPSKIAKQMEVTQQLRNERVLLSSAWGAFTYRVSKAQFSPTPLWCDLLKWEKIFICKPRRGSSVENSRRQPAPGTPDSLWMMTVSISLASSSRAMLSDLFLTPKYFIANPVLAG